MRCTIVLLLLCAACAPSSPPDVRAQPAAQETSLPASAFLAALPDGETKRQFILDCTGCHTFHAGIAYPGGGARTREAWETAITRMVGNFGHRSGFPVIGAGRDPAATARWLSESLPAQPPRSFAWPAGIEGRADVREYPLPMPQDLPHDVAIDGESILITGMFTGQMYILDPATGVVRTEATPQPNPRAVEVAANGDWWVVLGGPQLIAQRARNGTWKTFAAGFYAHSVALAPDGGVWVNGHFTHEPELIRRIDPVTGTHRDYTVPKHPAFNNTPVPYEIRVARDGIVWMSELQGNRLVRLDPATGAVKTWPMPTVASGPRRLDVDPNGIVWIPEYAANRLARFDPATERMQRFELPVPDAEPYIARWDARRGVVWIGTGAADAIFRFDPRTRRFTSYRLPTGDALVRHLTIDERTGDIWIVPGSSPEARPAARIVRLRPQD